MAEILARAMGMSDVLGPTRRPRLSERPTMDNWQRLEHILNQLTYRYAPERGVTAHYIAMCLNAWGVKAPPCATCGHFDNDLCSNSYHLTVAEHVITRYTAHWYVCKCGQTGSEQWALQHEYQSQQSEG